MCQVETTSSNQKIIFIETPKGRKSTKYCEILVKCKKSNFNVQIYELNRKYLDPVEVKQLSLLRQAIMEKAQ